MSELVIAEKSDLVRIADEIRRLSGTTGGLSLNEAIQKISLCHKGINATGGTFTLLNDTQNYLLKHGLGETPLFFWVGMGSSMPYSKTYILISCY